MISIGNYIKDVRGRDEAEKQRTVFVWTVILITIIFFVWVIYFSFSIYLNETENATLMAEAKRKADKLEAEASISNSTGTPISASTEGLFPSLGRMASDGLDSIANGFWVIGGMLHK